MALRASGGGAEADESSMDAMAFYMLCHAGLRAVAYASEPIIIFCIVVVVALRYSLDLPDLCGRPLRPRDHGQGAQQEGGAGERVDAYRGGDECYGC